MDENKRQTLVIRFDVLGQLRHLSHQETSRMFERAMTRAEVGVCYSQGFNPRPKMSLPLPRTVGVASKGDILCANVAIEDVDTEELKGRLQKQLPAECVIVGLDVADGKVSYKPESAEFEFVVEGLGADAAGRLEIEEFQKKCLSGEEIVVDRWSAKKRKNRKINVNEYIENVKVDGDTVNVKVKITQGGSVRVNEILELAGVGVEKVVGGVVRKNVSFVS